MARQSPELCSKVSSSSSTLKTKNSHVFVFTEAPVLTCGRRLLRALHMSSCSTYGACTSRAFTARFSAMATRPGAHCCCPVTTCERQLAMVWQLSDCVCLKPNVAFRCSEGFGRTGRGFSWRCLQFLEHGGLQFLLVVRQISLYLTFPTGAFSGAVPTRVRLGDAAPLGLYSRVHCIHGIAPSPSALT